ncbi:hypothetical protein VHEMI10301 [[Torrubiella] hemipterigena]|uniref:Uncharacterized protein n=1 Tax=[Torrubiella] hemipterigena TaxID=1531966 RepID=A0A0A1TIG2_9HYPO|nr:hypothetical protein VHEMI10301 [[Torrubiella] hemipterigena]
MDVPNLIHLPLEILLQIGGHVLSNNPSHTGLSIWHRYQGSLASLVLTCKTLNVTFTPLMYRYPVTTALPRLARTLIERPDLAALVKNAQLRLYPGLPAVRGEDGTKSWCITPEDAACLNLQARKSFEAGQVEPIESKTFSKKKTWDRGYYPSHESRMLIRRLLLDQCTNVERLDIELDIKDEVLFPTAPKLSKQSHVEEMVFRWLRDHSNYEGSNDTYLTDSLGTFIRKAKALRTLSMHKLATSYMPHTLRSTSVTELVLQQSLMTSNVLEDILASFPSLTTFRYLLDLEDVWMLDGMMNDAVMPEELVRILESHSAKHPEFKLRTLSLTWTDQDMRNFSFSSMGGYADESDIPRVASFRGLQHLEKVCLGEAGHVLGPGATDAQWAFFFPASVQVIEIGLLSRLPDLSLLLGVAHRYPNLKSFKYGGYFHESKAAALQLQFKAKGIKLEFNEERLFPDSIELDYSDDEAETSDGNTGQDDNHDDNGNEAESSDGNTGEEDDHDHYNDDEEDQGVISDSSVIEMD